MSKIAFAFIILAGLVSTPAAMAAQTSTPSAVLPNQVCHIGGSFKLNKSASNVAGLEACGMEMKSAKPGPTFGVSFVGFRLEPMNGLSFSPINMYGRCFYLSNASNDSYFIPAGTEKELKSFFNNKPNGVVAYPCAQPRVIDSSEFCGGKMFTNASQNYNTPGINALSFGRPGDVQRYYVVNADGQLLRTITATALANGQWTVMPSNPCPTNGAAPTPAQLNDLDSAAGGFDRNAALPVQNISTQNVQRVPVTDGAIQRNIEPANNRRVMINDGALVRNIR